MEGEALLDDEENDESYDEFDGPVKKVPGGGEQFDDSSEEDEDEDDDEDAARAVSIRGCFLALMLLNRWEAMVLTLRASPGPRRVHC